MIRDTILRQDPDEALPVAYYQDNGIISGIHPNNSVWVKWGNGNLQLLEPELLEPVDIGPRQRAMPAEIFATLEKGDIVTLRSTRNTYKITTGYQQNVSSVWGCHIINGIITGTPRPIHASDIYVTHAPTI
jgi:hypothetical protein